MSSNSLLEEKAAYERIHENAQRVLCEIGINLTDTPELMELLMEADAIDFEATDAVLVPLRRDYVAQCLALVPRKMPLHTWEITFGTGSWPPFLGQAGTEVDRPATADEFRQIAQLAASHADVVGVFSAPVMVDRNLSDFGCAQIMDQHFDGLKMITTRRMSDQEAGSFRGRHDWLDIVSLLGGLTPMSTMVEPFLRSCRLGNQVLLLDMSIAGVTAPQSPEALLTLSHAQELFMIVVAQTVTPGLVCVNSAIPGPLCPLTDNLSYSQPALTMVNAAMARLNQWVTGLPSCQSGGSTSEAQDVDLAAQESAFHRNVMRNLGVPMVRHSLGTMGDLNYFNIDKVSNAKVFK